MSNRHRRLRRSPIPAASLTGPSAALPTPDSQTGAAPRDRGAGSITATPQISDDAAIAALSLEQQTEAVGTDRHIAPPTSVAAVAEFSPRNPETLDPASLIWLPGAFRGFAPTAQYHAVRCIIGEGLRTKRKHVDDPPLPIMRCGAPTADGRQCGRSIRAHLAADVGKFHYVGAHCTAPRTGHTAVYSRAVEDAVFAILREAYDEASMARAVDGVVVRARAMRKRAHYLDQQLAQTAQRLTTLGKQALDAAGQLDSERVLSTDASGAGVASPDASIGASEALAATRADVSDEGAVDVDIPLGENAPLAATDRAMALAVYQHYHELRDTLLLEQHALKDERDALARALQGIAAPGKLPKQLELVRELAQKLDRLIARASRHRGMVRSLVGILTRRISLQTLGPGLALVEVELPNGGLVQRLVVTGAIRATQPALAWAYSQLRHGAAAADVAAAWPHTGTSRAQTRRMLPETVPVFALLYRFGPPPTMRMGPAETTAGLARRCLLTEEQIISAAVAGRLGPALASEGGQLLLTPTDGEVHLVAPAVAAFTLAGSFGWDGDEALELGRVARSVGLGATAFRTRYRLQAGDIRTGVSGRQYVRKGALPAELRTEAARGEAEARLRKSYEVKVATLVDGAGYDRALAPDFVPLNDLMGMFRRRFALGSPGVVTAARRAGTLITLEYRGPSPYADRPRPRILAYCPKAVRDSEEPTVYRNWLRGVLPGGASLPTPRHGVDRRRSKRRRSGESS